MKNQKLLNQILEKFRKKGVSQVVGYNSFGYVSETEKTITVSREKGKDTIISKSKILVGIEAFIKNSNLYYEGPAKLREYGITHVTSPIWSLLHLVPFNEYKN